MAVVANRVESFAIPTATAEDVAAGISEDKVVTPASLGSAAAASVEDFATAEQGAKADTALQPGDLPPVAVSGSYEDLADKPIFGSAAFVGISAFATAAQGALAETAVQPDDPVLTSLQGVNTAVAIWDSGTSRTMKQRATDTYCILDAPGAPDPTGANESTVALEAMAASGVKGELTKGTFVSTRKIVPHDGVVWNGHNSPVLEFGTPSGYYYDIDSKIVMAGTGLKEHTIAGATSRSVANPSAGEAYLADSGTRGNTYRNVDWTVPFSAGVIFGKGTRFNNIGVFPNFDLVEGYKGTDGRLSDDWDVGIWSRNADRAGGDIGVCSGHWRKAAILVSSSDIGDGKIPSAEGQIWAGWKMQGFWGLSIRSPETVVGSNWGFADTVFQHCDIRSLSHQSGHLATSSALAVPFQSPSGCLDIAGDIMSRVNFIGGRRMGYDDICDFFGGCSEIFFMMCYAEAKAVKVGGSLLANSQGARNIATADASGIMYFANRKYAIDLSPKKPRDGGVGRYTATGVFNPGFCFDDDVDYQRFSSWVGPRLSSGQGWRVQDENNNIPVQVTHDGIMSFGNTGGIELPSYTTAQLTNASHAVNTTGKFLNKIVINSSTGIVMRANGTSTTATWRDFLSGNVITPV